MCIRDRLNIYNVSSLIFSQCTIDRTGERYLVKMKQLFAAFFFIFGTITCLSPNVRVEQGELTGTTYPLKNGRSVFAFLGIPYAVPITHKNRFKVCNAFLCLLGFALRV